MDTVVGTDGQGQSTMAPKIDVEKAIKAVEVLLVSLGQDLSSTHLRDTPRRVVKAYIEFLTREDQSNLDVSFESHLSDQMVVVTDIRDVTYCPHHLAAAQINVSIGWVLGERQWGLSKAARLVRRCASQFITQEDLTEEIALAVIHYTKSAGAAVTIVGEHSCARHRGVRSHSNRMVTNTLKGVFLANPQARKEYFDLIQLAKTR